MAKWFRDKFTKNITYPVHGALKLDSGISREIFWPLKSAFFYYLFIFYSFFFLGSVISGFILVI